MGSMRDGLSMGSRLVVISSSSERDFHGETGRSGRAGFRGAFRSVPSCRMPRLTGSQGEKGDTEDPEIREERALRRPDTLGLRSAHGRDASCGSKGSWVGQATLCAADLIADLHADDVPRRDLHEDDGVDAVGAAARAHDRPAARHLRLQQGKVTSRSSASPFLPVTPSDAAGGNAFANRIDPR